MTRVIVNDWMMSMGTIALMKIGHQQKNPLHSSANVLEVPVEWIEALPERLFSYFMDNYSIAKKEIDALEKLVQGAMKAKEDKEKYKNYSKWINDRVKSYADRVKKYFTNYVEDLTVITIHIKSALEEKDEVLLKQEIKHYCDILSIEEVNQKLTLNWVKPTLLSPSGGQVSFLNVAKNGETYKQQIATFKRDFIDTAVWELTLQQFVEEQNETSINEHMKSENAPKYAKAWVKAQKSSKLSWVDYLSTVPSCSLIEGQWGTIPFEEMYFVPLGLAMMPNTAWNGDTSAVQHISSLARLMLFLSPLGCSRYRRPINGQEQMVFGFLHDETNCEYTFTLNNQLLKALQRDALFTDALKDTFSKMKELENRRKNATMLIEWETYYTAKKTILEYKPLNQQFVSFLLNSESNKLNVTTIKPFSFRESVVRAALDNQDSKYLIFKEFNRILNENASSTYSIYSALRMRESILMEGGQAVITEQMYKLGYSLNQKLIGSRKENEDGSYQSPNEKKLATIVYRLLNAAKGGNRQLFFDTAVRLHVLANMNVSKNFTKLLDSETTDKEFATIALAFIAGLTPSKDSKTNEKPTPTVS
ncbi:hypothetical protein [Lysinibacillus sp. 54212]|uniref:hypothetical protein n=1 Tax=Lysinibacillus sp. 54212 TaxID=3119829 RepID=UPI002FCBE35D